MATLEAAQLRMGLYLIGRPIHLRFLRLRRIALSVFALSILNNLRQLHEPGHGHFPHRGIYHGTRATDTVIVLAHASFPVRQKLCPWERRLSRVRGVF